LRDHKNEKSSSPTGNSPEAPAPGWAVREMFPVFLSTAIVLMVLTSSVVAWRYYVVFKGCSASRLETACAWFQNVYVDAISKQDSGLNSAGSDSNLATELGWSAVEYANAEFNLANFLDINGRDLEAIVHYRIVLSLERHLDTNEALFVQMLTTANNNLAWLLATTSDPHLRNGEEAVRLGERACQLTQYQEAFMIGTLAAAYAEAGRLDDAVVAAQKARAMALAHGQEKIAEINEQLLKLYQSGQAYHHEANAIP
jgi:hypothetical protein